MSSSYGDKVKISIFGQSHSEAIGVVIDGLPAGEEIDLEAAQRFLDRRAPGKNAYSTPRKEGDQVRVVSGLFNGMTCGVPICAMIENTNTRSKDYDELKDMPRPGHADFTAEVKYKGFQDHRGGGHFSGRLTAPLCFAGAVCLQILERRGIFIGGHILSIHEGRDKNFDPVRISKEELAEVIGKEFPTIDDVAGEKMREIIQKAKEEDDSVGGVIESVAIGLPVGLGDPMFDGLESKISSILFAIPAVKGVEFGEGFGVAELFGSENNDSFYIEEDAGMENGRNNHSGSLGEVRTRTNNHGGSLGGISSGMPLVIRTAFKPTPSIGKNQETVSLRNGKSATLSVEGRHDPCIVPRAVPCVEAAMAIAILDLF